MPQKLPDGPRADKKSTYEDFLRAEVERGVQNLLLVCENLPPGMKGEETTDALISIFEAAKSIVLIMGMAVPAAKNIAAAQDRVARAYTLLQSLLKRSGLV